MAGFQVHRITNAAIYLDGNSFFGRAEEVDLGSITAVMSEHVGLGMVGVIELPDGLEKLEGKIIWNSLYEDAAALTGSAFKSVQLQCRSSVSVHNSQGRTDELPLVTFLTVTFKGYQLGSYKPREAAKFESSFSATTVRQLLNGKEIVMLDYLANIYKINGEDQLSKYRENLGM